MFCKHYICRMIFQTFIIFLKMEQISQEQVQEIVAAKNNAITALYDQLLCERDRNKRREIIRKIRILKNQIRRILELEQECHELEREIFEMTEAIQEAVETIVDALISKQYYFDTYYKLLLKQFLLLRK